MERKFVARGLASGLAVKKRAKKPSRAAPKLFNRERTQQRTVERAWGPVYVDETDFSDLEKCILTPQKPTQSIAQAAALIEELYHKRR